MTKPLTDEQLKTLETALVEIQGRYFWDIARTTKPHTDTTPTYDYIIPELQPTPLPRTEDDAPARPGRGREAARRIGGGLLGALVGAGTATAKAAWVATEPQCTPGNRRGCYTGAFAEGSNLRGGDNLA